MKRAACPARPGLRRSGGPGRVAGAAALALLAVAAAGCSAASQSQSQSQNKFGGYPSFLPKSTLHYGDDTVLTGTVRRPALTVEGDGVEVVTPRWSVLIVVTGPQVPGEGLPYQPQATTCTWVVTMSRATGPVPVSASDFSSIDQENHAYLPAFVPGQPLPPRFVRPGATVRFELRAVEAVGEGLMRWAPDGRNIVAKWDFVVEND